MTGSSARSIRGTMAAASAPAIEIDTQGFPVVAVEVAGTFVQTLIVEETISGDNWVTAQSFDATGAPVSATITAAGRCFVKAGGRSAIRVRQTAFTSGSATVVMDTGEGSVGAASGGGGGGGAVTVADGADLAEGATTDAAVTTNTTGTLSGKLRGLVAILADVWDSVNHWLTVRVAKIPGTVSAANSSTATLTAGSTFTGTGEDVSGYATIEVMAFADQASAVGGVRAQFSSDNANWDVSDVQADQVAGTGRSFFFKPRGQFFRFVYVNGGTNQGAFRLQTVYHTEPVNVGAETNRSQNTNGAGVLGDGPLLRSVALGSAPTSAITIGNFLQWICNAVGIPFVLGGHPNTVTIAVNYTTAQTDTPIVTISAGTKIVVTSFLAILGNPATVNVPVRIGFGTANVPAYGSNGILGGHPNVAPGSGFGRGNGSGIVGQGADDEDLRITSGVPTGDSLSVMITYHTVPV